MQNNITETPEIRSNLVFLHPQVTSDKELIQLMAQRLINDELVKNDFIEAILERENEYPTGVPIGDIAAAIPHTDAIHVKKSAMVVSILENPVYFGNMANPDQNLPVQIVFMLAMKEPAYQVSWLKKLLKFLNNPQNLKTLQTIKTEQDMVDYLHNHL
jgi:PTS system galactitol-specific IIA component